MTTVVVLACVGCAAIIAAALWAIFNPFDDIKFQVKGVTHDNADGSSRQEAIRKCSVGERVQFIFEPDNPVDANAVKICRTNGGQLGYVPAIMARDFGHQLTAGRIEGAFIGYIFRFAGRRRLRGMGVTAIRRKKEPEVLTNPANGGKVTFPAQGASMPRKNIPEIWQDLGPAAKTAICGVSAFVVVSALIFDHYQPAEASSFMDPAPLLIFGVLAYFFPALCALGKRNRGAIFALNLLLGWTVIGWIVALIWGLTNDAPEPIAPAPVPASVPPPLLCSRCGTYSLPTACFCSTCATPFAAPPIQTSSPSAAPKAHPWARA